jgi:hypothetical protein
MECGGASSDSLPQSGAWIRTMRGTITAKVKLDRERGSNDEQQFLLGCSTLNRTSVPVPVPHTPSTVCFLQEQQTSMILYG